MPSVNEARYNSDYSTAISRHRCTPETRTKILQDLKTWAKDEQGAKVYWMNGMVGTGKTTIRYSFCEWLATVQQLGANFFCSRTTSCAAKVTTSCLLSHPISRNTPLHFGRNSAKY